MVRDVRSVFRDISLDKNVRAIVLSGAGRATTSGLDCKPVFLNIAMWYCNTHFSSVAEQSLSSLTDDSTDIARNVYATRKHIRVRNEYCFMHVDHLSIL